VLPRRHRRAVTATSDEPPDDCDRPDGRERQRPEQRAYPAVPIIVSVVSIRDDQNCHEGRQVHDVPRPANDRGRKPRDGEHRTKLHRYGSSAAITADRSPPWQAFFMRPSNRFVRGLSRGARVDLVGLRVVCVRNKSGYEFAIHRPANRYAVIAGVAGGYGLRIRFVTPGHVTYLGTQRGMKRSRRATPRERA
jgi:hypothetical protein